MLTENAWDVIWVYNLTQQKNTYISPSNYKLRGYTPEEAMGISLENLHLKEQVSDILEIVKKEYVKFIESGKRMSEPFITEAQTRHKNGELIWVEDYSHFQYNDQNEIELYGVTRNIESRKSIEIALKNSEAELRNINILKDKLFSIIAHDLRGPVGNLTLGLKMLAELKENDELQKEELLDELQKAAKTSYDLLENLLNWSRIQSGTIALNPENLILNHLVEESSEHLMPIAVRKGITVKTVAREVFGVWADKNSVSLVIRNLLSNAIKFTPTGGEITVTLEDKGNFVETAITDTGTGIEQEVLNVLFDPFENHIRYGTNGEKGSGLGLVLCQEFTENNGGKIYAESEPGKGSRFAFTLPRSAAKQ